MRDRRPLPQKIADAPILLPGLDLFYNAFTALSTCRQQGWSEGDIPWTAISEYCDRNSLTGEQRADTFYFVRSLDLEYLKFKAKKADENKGKGGKKSGKSG